MANPNVKFSFINNIPNIIDAFKNKKPVQIYIPVTNAVLNIDVSSQDDEAAAINFARSKVLLYMSNIRGIRIPQSNTLIPCTSKESITHIMNYINSEQLAIRKINKSDI